MINHLGSPSPAKYTAVIQSWAVLHSGSFYLPFTLLIEWKIWFYSTVLVFFSRTDEHFTGYKFPVYCLGWQRTKSQAWFLLIDHDDITPALKSHLLSLQVCLCSVWFFWRVFYQPACFAWYWIAYLPTSEYAEYVVFFPYFVTWQ